jgi:hypothetical protein
MKSDIHPGYDHHRGQVSRTSSPKADAGAVKWWGWGLEVLVT